jgi:hypothetical protein
MASLTFEYIDPDYIDGDYYQNGLTIDWLTKVIFVPREVLTLVQSVPSFIYSLDINDFRLALKVIEASEEGMPNPDTHTHNTTYVISGVTYARAVQIINGYTVTFEDGQYAVNLLGANTNLGDVVNVNQVSVRPNNSAGLIESPDLGTVTVDVDFIKKLLANKVTISTDDTTTTIYDDDKVTPIHTFTHADTRNRDPV